MDNKRKAKIEKTAKRIYRLGGLAERHLEEGSTDLKKGNLLISHNQGSYESGCYDWPTFTNYARTKVILLGEGEQFSKNVTFQHRNHASYEDVFYTGKKVLEVDKSKIITYSSGEWEKNYKKIFSSKKNIQNAKKEFEEFIDGLKEKHLEESEKKREEKRLKDLADILNL